MPKYSIYKNVNKGFTTQFYSLLLCENYHPNQPRRKPRFREKLKMAVIMPVIYVFKKKNLSSTNQQISHIYYVFSHYFF